MSFSYVYKDEERYGFKSQVTFGAVDSSRFEGPLKLFPIADKKYLTMKIDDILFNG